MTGFASMLASGSLGAVLALVGQWLVRGGRARAAQRLCVALKEELSAVLFHPSSHGSPNFTCFSAQTFDSVLGRKAQDLPTTLTRDLIEYYQVMKYLEEIKPWTIPHTHWVHWQMFAEAHWLHDRLIGRLGAYADRRWWSGLLAPFREMGRQSVLWTPPARPA